MNTTKKIITAPGKNLLAALSLAVCVGLPTVGMAQSKECLVKVPFDANGCPQAVTNTCDGAVVPDLSLSADKDTIQWQAYDMSLSTTVDNTYKVFFDPFRGASAEAKGNDNGRTSKQKTKKSNEIPTNVEFKYTIWADGCPDQPLDPRFKVY